MRIFFATNRQQEDQPRRVGFGWRPARDDSLSLGKAVVTVPRTVHRRPGEIRRPTWWELNILRVPPEGNPAKHFVIVPNAFEIYASRDDFLSAVGRHMLQAGRYKDHAFVFVHGYRVSFDDALYRTAQIAYDLGEPRQGDNVVVPFGTPFLFSWPSAGELKDYAYDQEQSRLAVEHLKTFVKMIVKKSGAKHVHLIAHSMGNVPLLNALSAIGGTSEDGTRVSQVILAAPDMGVDEFKRLSAKIKPYAEGVTLYASSNDFAMEASRLVHKDRPRAGDVVGDAPTVVDGVDSIDISVMTTCYFCFGHDEYVEQPELLNDIAQLLRAGARPPHSRNVNLKLRQLQGIGSFWRYSNR